MNNKPLSLIRHLDDFDGFNAWRYVELTYQRHGAFDKTEESSRALLTQLSKVEFSSSKTIREQIQAYDSLVREYERISGNRFPQDSMIASIVLALPMALRIQLQMQITKSTRYEYSN